MLRWLRGFSAGAISGAIAYCARCWQARGDECRQGQIVSINSDGMFVHTTKLAATVCVQSGYHRDGGRAPGNDLSGDAKLKELIAELERLGLKEYL